MLKFSFLHVSDLHLDSPFLSVSHYPQSLKKALVDAPINSFRNLVSQALDRKVDFVIISGDIFDKANVSLRIQEHFVSILTGLSKNGINVLIICGNHDFDFFSRNSELFDSIPGIYFFSEEVNFIPLQVRGETVEIFGSKFTPELNWLEQKNLIGSKAFKICLYHGQIDGTSGDVAYANQKLMSLLNFPIDYWALGHIHQSTILNRNPYVVYSGTTQGRSFKPSEQGKKGGFIVSVENNYEIDISFIEGSEIVYQTLNLTLEWNDSAHLFYLELKGSIEKELKTIENGLFKYLVLRINITCLELAGNFPTSFMIQEIEQLLSEYTFKLENGSISIVVDYNWSFKSRTHSKIQEEIIQISEKLLSEGNQLFSTKLSDELLKPRLKLRKLNTPDFSKLNSDCIELIKKLTTT